MLIRLSLILLFLVSHCFNPSNADYSVLNPRYEPTERDIKIHSIDITPNPIIRQEKAYISIELENVTLEEQSFDIELFISLKGLPLATGTYHRKYQNLNFKAQERKILSIPGFFPTRQSGFYKMRIFVHRYGEENIITASSKSFTIAAPPKPALKAPAALKS